MSLITLLNASLAWGDLPLLDGAVFSLETGERVGLIGSDVPYVCDAIYFQLIDNSGFPGILLR